jgi:hypothetical protein
VPFAEGCRGIAVVGQNLGNGGRGVVDLRIVPWITGGKFRDDPGSDLVNVIAGQQRAAGRGTNRGHGHVRVSNAFIPEPIERGGAHDAPVGSRTRITAVIQHDNEYIGRTVGRFGLPDKIGFRVRQGFPLDPFPFLFRIGNGIGAFTLLPGSRLAAEHNRKRGKK